nr:choice-of-anchor I family protein [Fontibacillus panacisegetis]
MVLKLKRKKMISLVLAAGVAMSSVATGGIITAAELPATSELTELTGGEYGVGETSLTSLSVEPEQDFGLTDIILPEAKEGSPYSVTLAVYSGVSPYHFTANGLPSGLAINNNSGIISGVPAVGTAGKYPVAVTIQDSSSPAQSINRQLELTVGQAAIEPTRDVIKINPIASYSVGTASEDGGVAEIVKYNKDNGKFYLVNGASNPPSIDIVSLKTGHLTKEKTISVKELVEDGVFQYGDLTSIDINTVTNTIAVAVQEAAADKHGKILVLDYEGNPLQSYEAGVQPDMVKFTSDGRYILTADEGEPREAGVDPEGSVTLVDTTNGEVTHIKFDNPNVIDDLVHIRGLSNPDGTITSKGSKSDAIRDLEPEYISLSADERTAYVSLQENNAIAEIDLTTKTVTSVKGLGYKNFNDPNNAIDVVKDGKIKLENVPFLGMYMPDGIATYTVGEQTYVLTANEGDATEWPGRVNVSTIKDIYTRLDISSEASQFLLVNKKNYEKVEVASDMGSDNVYLYGGRSFSIWNAADMTQVYDSGSDFEKITAERLPDYFNSNHKEIELDGRSRKKGPEPEYVTVGKVGSKTFAFVGLERIGGVMTYDVTDPSHPTFVNYVNTRSFDSNAGLNTDLGPEGLEFIEAKDSPTHRPLLLVANEVSGTVTVLELDVAEENPEPDTWELTVMHTNDTHAHLADVARRATLVKEIRNEGGNSLLLDAGDVFSGDLYFTKWLGMADLAFMNYLGYDAMTFGNHEFDQGTRVLADFIKQANFPLVSSNIDFSKDENIASLVKSPIVIDAAAKAEKTTANAGVYPYVILDVNGVQVGVFGMTTEDTAETSSPGKNVTFKNAQESAKETVSLMEQKGLKHIIALSHLGYGRDKVIADAIEGIDLIVGGHTHTKLNEPEILTDSIHNTPTVIVQANEWGKFLGRVDLVFDPNGVIQTGEGQTKGQLITVDNKVAEDTIAKEMLAPYNAELEELKKQVVGTASIVLDGERKNVRSKETNLGNLIADGMLSKAKQLKNADIAIMNGGGIRASIDQGEITMGELRTVMPFGNTLFVLDVTGQQLKDGLENGISGAKLSDLPGKFPQIAGMKFKWDPDGTAGNKVFDIMIKRGSGYEPLNLSSTYRLATNSFVANGGDGYASFAAAIASGAYHEDLGYPDYEIFMQYVEALGGNVSPQVEKRIVEQAKPNGSSNNGNGNGESSSSSSGSGVSAPGAASGKTESDNKATQSAGHVLSGNQLTITQGVSRSGQQVQQVTVNADALAAAIARATASGQGELVIDLDGLEGAIDVVLSAQALGLNSDSGKNNSITVVIKSDLATYQLPVQLLGQAGNVSAAKAKDSKLHISILPVSQATQEKLNQSSAALGATMILPMALDFQVTLSDNVQNQALNDFGKNYITRIIPIPSNVKSDNVTAVRYDEKTGRYMFVPSTRVTIDGQPALQVKSPGNGIFTLIEYSKNFADLQGHWAKAEIEALASKWIVRGVTENQYNPSQSVSRAEFTALLVRSLGLTPDQASNRFVDVTGDEILSGEIGAAVKIGLVQGSAGKDGQSFAPNESLSRSEMAVMIARAIRIIQGDSAPSVANSDRLSRFQDYSSIPDWAAQDIAWLVEQEIMKGNQKGAFAPNGTTTRAEAAIILIRTLKALHLID